MTRLSNSSTIAAAAGISMASPASGITAGQGREADGQHKELGHQGAGPAASENPANRKRATAKSQTENASSSPSVKTAPQKESTGAPVRSWVPYQTAAASSAAASRATTTAMTRIARGPTAPAGAAGPSAGVSGRSVPRESPRARLRDHRRDFAGSSRDLQGFTGGLDTLAHYRT